MSAARNDGPGAGRHGPAGPSAPPRDTDQEPGQDEPGWSLPDARDGRMDTGELRRNPVTGPNAFGLGNHDGTGTGPSWRGRSGYGSYDPDDSLFDIADDRRDDGATRWSSAADPDPLGSDGRDRPSAPAIVFGRKCNCTRCRPVSSMGKLSRRFSRSQSMGTSRSPIRNPP